MRKRFAILLAGGGRWPDAQTGGIGFAFNWVKVDNKGANPVSLGINANPAAGDAIDTYATIPAGTVRVFNLAGPKNPDGSLTEDWPDQVYLVSASGTTVLLEVSDCPIVDLQTVPAGTSALPGIVRIEDAFASTLASVAPNNLGDATAQVQALDVINFPYVFNGTTWDRLRSAGGPGYLAVGDTTQFNVETTTLLGANATFTGPWRNTLNYNWIAALAMTDAATGAGTGLAIDEADSSTPNIINTVSITGAGAAPPAGNVNSPSGGFVHRVTPQKVVLQWNRVRFLNGATPQTRLNIQSALSPLN